MQKKDLKSRNLTVCIRNRGYETSLERRKLYRVLPDAEAAKHGQVRVIDESGDDYLYPGNHFVAVRLPESVKSAVIAA
ncbi:MAG: hypothetical protein FJ039_12570 [Chloroflexi bacterium]|nr:hypothetical protein [Chloroflexota bacterium]